MVNFQNNTFLFKSQNLANQMSILATQENQKELDIIDNNSKQFFHLILAVYANDKTKVNQILFENSQILQNYFGGKDDYNRIKKNPDNIDLKSIKDRLSRKFNESSFEITIMKELDRIMDISSLGEKIYKIICTDNNEVENFKIIPPIDDDFVFSYVKVYLFAVYADKIKENMPRDFQIENKMFAILINQNKEIFKKIRINYKLHDNWINKISNIYDIQKKIDPNFTFNSFEEVSSYINVYNEFVNYFCNYHKLDNYRKFANFILSDDDNKVTEINTLINKYINDNDPLIIKLVDELLYEFSRDNIVLSNRLNIIKEAIIVAWDKNVINKDTRIIDLNKISNLDALKRIYILTDKIIYLDTLEKLPKETKKLFINYRQILVKQIKNGLILPDKIFSLYKDNEVINLIKKTIKHLTPRIMHTLNLEVEMLLMAQTLSLPGSIYSLSNFEQSTLINLIPITMQSIITIFNNDVFSITPYFNKHSNNRIEQDFKELLDFLLEIKQNKLTKEKEDKLLELLNYIQNHYLPEWFNNITNIYIINGKKLRFTLAMIFDELLIELQKNQYGNKYKNELTNLIRSSYFPVVETTTKVNINELIKILLKLDQQLYFSTYSRVEITSLLKEFEIKFNMLNRNLNDDDIKKQIDDLKAVYTYIVKNLINKIKNRTDYLGDFVNIMIFIGTLLMDLFGTSINSNISNMIINSTTASIRGDSTDYVNDHIKPMLKNNKTITNNTIKYLAKRINPEFLSSVDIGSNKKKELIKSNPKLIKIFADKNFVKEILDDKSNNIDNNDIRYQFYEHYLDLTPEETVLLCSNNLNQSPEIQNQKIELFNKIYSRLFISGFNQEIYLEVLLNLIEKEPDLELKKYFIHVVENEIKVSQKDKLSRMHKLKANDWKRYLINFIATFLFTMASILLLVFSSGIMIPFLIAGIYFIITIIKELILYQLDTYNYKKSVKYMFDRIKEIKQDVIRNEYLSYTEVMQIINRENVERFLVDQKKIDPKLVQKWLNSVSELSSEKVIDFVSFHKMRYNNNIGTQYCENYLKDIESLPIEKVSDKVINFLTENATNKHLIIENLEICMSICKNKFGENSQNYLYLRNILRSKLLNISSNLGIVEIINRNDHIGLYIVAKTIFESIMIGFICYLSFIKVIFTNMIYNALMLTGIITLLRTFIVLFRNKFYQLFSVHSVTHRKIKKILDLNKDNNISNMPNLSLI